MKNQDVKNLIHNAYSMEASEKELAFLRKYEKRSMRLLDTILLEMKHVKWTLMFYVAILIALFIAIMKVDNPQFIWYVSGAIPVIGLILMTSIGRSERYGMHELEASCRFSLQFVRTIRMFLIGVASLVLLIGCSLLLKGQSGFGFVTIVGFIGTPYMLNIWGNLIITRRWHAKESLIGCVALTMGTCMLPLLFEKMVKLELIAPILIAVAFVILTALAVREGMKYMKESEELSWNFC